MNIYKKMYLSLFNAVTDALALLPGQHPAAKLLRRAQCCCEEEFMLFDDNTPLTEISHTSPD